MKTFYQKKYENILPEEIWNMEREKNQKKLSSVMHSDIWRSLKVSKSQGLTYY